ncbi:MAG TPA: hypothetical protein DEH78_32305 [Solibacterales bacterium]|nr:hypothetical protein [Bryobacterales bacterium]
MTQVLVCSNSEQRRREWRLALEAHACWRAVETASLNEALAVARQLPLHCAVLDQAVLDAARLPEFGCAVVVCGPDGGETAWKAALDAGAQDYYVNGGDARGLVSAVEKAAYRHEQHCALGDAAPHLIWTWRTDGTVDCVNRRWREFTGMSLEQAQQGQHWKLLRRADRHAAQTAYAAALESGQPFEMQCRIRPKEGRGWRWLQVQCVPVTDGAGRIARWLGTATDVDSLKRSELAMRASAGRFRRLFDENPLGIALEDENGCFLSVNAALCRMLGYQVEELLGRSFRGLTRHESPGIRALVRRDGTLVWTRIHEEEGNGQGQRFTLVEDITAHKAGEEERRLLVTVLENTPDFVGLARMDGSVFYVNRAGCRLVGLAGPEEAVRLSIEEYGYPDDLRLYREEIMPAVKRGEVWQGEIRFRHQATGEPIPMEMRAFAIFDERGRRIGFANVSRDIRERKAIESALQASERQHRMLIQTLPQMVWMTRSDGACDYLSPQWLEYTGVPEAAQWGNGWAQTLHPEDRERTVQSWTESVATGARYDIEYRLRRHDGVYRWFKARAVRLTDEHGRVARWIGVCTDIHDQKSVENALRRSNAELEQFAYVASHDLQEPLRNATIYAQLLERRCGASLDAEAREYLDNVVRSSQRMRQLVDDLLTYSRLSADCGSSVADPRAAVEVAIENLQELVRETGAAIQCGPMPAVQANQSQLAAVFQNLLSNSLKYARPGTPPVVRVEAAATEGVCTFSVRDNGQGFEPRYAEKIFGIFKRLHGASVPGTGIGLAIVKNIVERHGGTAWAEGEPGAGATIYFTLPVA